MNITNVLNFITHANLSGINQINAALAAQAQQLANVARQAAGATAAAQRMQAAWNQARNSLMAARAAQLGVNAWGQGRNALGQFMSRAATQQAIANAASFSRTLRAVLASAFTASNIIAPLQAQVQKGVASMGQAFSALSVTIKKALSFPNVMQALKVTAAATAAAIASLISNGAKAAGNAIRTFIGGALQAAMVPAKALAGILRNVKGGIGNVGIAGALVAIGGIKAGYTVDKMLAKINTIARETKPNLDLIAQGLERIAFTTGTTFSDNAEAYYDLLSAGLGVKDGVVDITTTLQLMQDAANLAVGGIGSMKDSLDFLTTALNAFRGPLTKEFGDPLLASTKIADAFAKSVELGKTTVAELAPVFSTAAPLAAQLGVDWREMAAILAAMTQQGFDAGETFTALRSALVGTQRNSKALQDALKDIDVKAVLDQFDSKTWLDLIKNGGFAVFAETLRDYSEKTGVPLIKLLGRIEGVQAILGVTGAQAENYAYILDQVTNSSGNAAAQAELFNDSLAAQLNLFKNTLFAIGDALFRRRIIDPLKDFVRTLNEAAGVVYEFVVANEKLFDVLVPLFTFFTGLTALTKGASAIENIFLRLGGPISGFAIGIGRIGMMMAWTLGPILGVVVAFQTFKRLVEYGVLPVETFGTVLGHLAVAAQDIQKVFGLVGDLIGDFVDIVTGQMGALGTEISLDFLFKNFADAAGPLLDEAALAFKRAIDDFIAGVQKELGDGFGDKAGAIGRSVLKALQGAWDWLAPRAGAALAAALTFGAEVVTNVVEFGARVASNIGQAIIDALPKAAEFISGIPDAVSGAINEDGAFSDVKGQLGEWWQSLIDWFTVNGPALLDGIVAVFESIGRVLGTAIPKALGSAGDLLSDIWDNIYAKREDILAGAGEFIGNVVEALGDLAEAVIPPLAAAAGKLIDWITRDAIPYVAGAVASFIDEVVRAIVPLGEDDGKLDEGLTNAGAQLVDWITSRVPDALRALLKWTIEVENWIITVLMPRIGAAFLAVGLAVVGFLWDGLVAAAKNPGQFISDMADVVYALLAAGLIIKAAAAAGAVVGAAYQAAIYAVRVGGAFLRGFATSIAADLVAAGVSAATTAGATLGAGVLATTLAAAIGAVVVAIAVGIKIKTEIQAQGDALVAQTKEWVKTASVDALRAGKAALRDASNKLDLILDLGVLTGDVRVDIQQMNNEIDAALKAAGETVDPRPLALQLDLKPTFSTGSINPPNKRDELQAYIDAHPMPTVEMEVPLKLKGTSPEEVQAKLDEVLKKFDITETVTKFKSGTAALVEEWNSWPSRLMSTQELLHAALFNEDGTLKSFDLGPTVTAIQTGYADILAAMQSTNPQAILLAQALGRDITQMAIDTNAAFVAAGQAPPFLIDKITGAVTLTAEASKLLGDAVITPISAIPPTFTDAGDSAGTLAPAISSVVPTTGNAAQDLANAILNPLTPVPGKTSDLGDDTSANWVSGFRLNIPAAGRAGDAVAGGALYPLKPTGGLRTDVKGWGSSVSGSWISGFISSIAGAAQRIWNALMAALLGAKGDSPPKVGPLQHIDRWGENIGMAWVDGLVSGLETAPGRVAMALAAAGAAMTDSQYALEYAPAAQAPVNRDVTVRHTVRFDGKAPDGITESGVAGFLQKGVDASGLIRNLKHATGVR